MDAQVHHAIARLKDALGPFGFVICIQDDSGQRYWSFADRDLQEELEHKGGINLSDVDIILNDEQERASARSEVRRPPLLQPPPGVRPSPPAESFLPRYQGGDQGTSSAAPSGGRRSRNPLLPRPLSNLGHGRASPLAASSAGASEPKQSWSFTSSATSVRESFSGGSINIEESRFNIKSKGSLGDQDMRRHFSRGSFGLGSGRVKEEERGDHVHKKERSKSGQDGGKTHANRRAANPRYHNDNPAPDGSRERRGAPRGGREDDDHFADTQSHDQRDHAESRPHSAGMSSKGNREECAEAKRHSGGQFPGNFEAEEEGQRNKTRRGVYHAQDQRRTEAETPSSSRRVVSPSVETRPGRDPHEPPGGRSVAESPHGRRDQDERRFDVDTDDRYINNKGSNQNNHRAKSRGDGEDAIDKNQRESDISGYMRDGDGNQRNNDTDNNGSWRKNCVEPGSRGRHRSDSLDARTRCVFLENIDADLRKEALRYLLEECGPVDRLRYDEGNKGGAGKARVLFESIDGAAKAFAKFHGFKLGRSLRIRVKYCVPFDSDDGLDTDDYESAEDEDRLPQRLNPSGDKVERKVERRESGHPTRMAAASPAQEAPSRSRDGRARSGGNENVSKQAAHDSSLLATKAKADRSSEGQSSNSVFSKTDKSSAAQRRVRPETGQEAEEEKGKRTSKRYQEEGSGSRVMQTVGPKNDGCSRNERSSARGRQDDDRKHATNKENVDEVFKRPSICQTESRQKQSDYSEKRGSDKGEARRRGEQPPPRRSDYGGSERKSDGRKEESSKRERSPVDGNEELPPRRVSQKFFHSFKPISDQNEAPHPEDTNKRRNSSTSTVAGEAGTDPDTEEAISMEISSHKIRSSPSLSLRFSKDELEAELTDYEAYADEEELNDGARLKSASSVEQQKLAEGKVGDTSKSLSDMEQLDYVFDLDEEEEEKGKRGRSLSEGSDKSSSRTSTAPPGEESKRKASPLPSGQGADAGQASRSISAERRRPSRRSTFEEPRGTETKSGSTRSQRPTSGEAKGTSSSRREALARRERRKELPKAYAIDIREAEAERKWGKPTSAERPALRRRGRFMGGAHRGFRFAPRPSSFCSEAPSNQKVPSTPASKASPSQEGGGLSAFLKNSRDADPQRLVRAVSVESVMDPRNRPSSFLNPDHVYPHNDAHSLNYHQHRHHRHPVKDVSSVRKHGKDDVAAGRRICIMNIDPTALESEFLSLVSQYGLVEDIQVVRVTEMTPRSRATVQYSRPDQALNARNGLMGVIFGRFRLYTCLGHAQPYLFHTDDPAVPMVPIVYVKGIRSEVDPQHIGSVFAKFGPVLEIRRGENPPNARPVTVKGVFILYQDLESAVDACLRMDGCALPGWESSGGLDVGLFHSLRGREASTGLSLIREYRSSKKATLGQNVPQSQPRLLQPGREEPLPPPPKPQRMIPSLIADLGQPTSRLPPFMPVRTASNQSLAAQVGGANRVPRRQRRHSHDPPTSRNRFAPSSHQRFHPFHRSNASDSISPRRNVGDGRRCPRPSSIGSAGRGRRRGRISNNPSIKSSSSSTTTTSSRSERGPKPMTLNEGVPTDVDVLVDLKDSVPQICDAVFTKDKYAHAAR